MQLLHFEQITDMSTEIACNEVMSGSLQFQKFNYMWTIYRFMKYFVAFDYPVISSPNFSSDTNNSTKWRIHLYPNGESENSSGNFSIFLILMKCDFEAEISFTFSILNAKGDKVNKRTMKNLKFSPGPHGMIWGFHDFTKKDFVFNSANNLLSHFMLTICCEINFSIKDNLKVDTPEPIPEVCQDFGILLESGRFSDVTLLCKGRKFRVHKNILAVHSPVFSAMFEHDMKEKQDNVVTILDIEPETVEEMLRFIYTKKIVNIETNVCEIINAANKYQLDELKSQCETVLSNNLNIENAVAMLTLADQANAIELKNKAINFILVHLKEISDSMGFNALGESHWYLLKEILTCMAVQQSNREI